MAKEGMDENVKESRDLNFVDDKDIIYTFPRKSYVISKDGLGEIKEKIISVDKV